LQKTGQCGDTESFQGNFIDVVLDVIYLRFEYRLPDGGTDGLFLAFPAESGLQRLRETKVSYIVLGDASNCWQARGALSRPQFTSTFERLLRVWDDIKGNKDGDCLSSFHPNLVHLYNEEYMEFSGGRCDVFNQLLLIEKELLHFGFRSRFKGICRVRDRLRRDGDMLVVLYPLFL
jgi:hypothetical protein